MRVKPIRCSINDAVQAPGYDGALKQNDLVGSAHTRKGPVGPLNP
jgi:hypothetical protein